MLCQHLKPLEEELISKHIKETYRGQAWSDNCREWAYFDCVFTNLDSTMSRLGMDKESLEVHSHFGTHDGQEHGVICKECRDGIMGRHPDSSRSGVIEYI